MNVPVDRWWTNARLATFSSGETACYGTKESYAIGISGDHIVAVVPANQVSGGEITDVQGRWITPGLIDCHTHLIFGGSRAAEWEMRLTGVPYAEIARRGGGILNTVRATRALNEDELYQAALPRLRALMAEGVTTIEIKS